MKVTIIGYGTMGHEIEKILIERGHTIADIIDIGNTEKLAPAQLIQTDVAIEFTTPSAAYNNVTACLKAGIPVVCGTTGWNQQRADAEALCQQLNGTFLWASNFSVGVNILFHVNKLLARIMERFPEYNVAINETHHTRKLDSPSGTAVTLAEHIIQNLSRKTTWSNSPTDNAQTINIESFREGDVAGIHEIIYDSPADLLSLRHEAKSRRGFALGAVMAAEFAAAHTGVLSFDDIFKDLI